MHRVCRRVKPIEHARTHRRRLVLLWVQTVSQCGRYSISSLQRHRHPPFIQVSINLRARRVLLKKLHPLSCHQNLYLRFDDNAFARKSLEVGLRTRETLFLMIME